MIAEDETLWDKTLGLKKQDDPQLSYNSNDNVGYRVVNLLQESKDDEETWVRGCWQSDVRQSGGWSSNVSAASLGPHIPPCSSSAGLR